MDTLKKILENKFQFNNIAINGIRDVPEFNKVIKALFKSEKYQFTEMSGDSLLNPNDFYNILFNKLHQINSEHLEKFYHIGDAVNKIISELPNYFDVLFIIVNLTDSSENNISKIFRVIRDVEPHRKIKLLFVGNWPHYQIKNDIKKDVSYPFTLGREEFYLCDLIFGKGDFSEIHPLLNFHDAKTWELIIDYTNGEFLTTTYMMNEIKPGEITELYADKLWENKCFDYYKFIMKRNEIEQIKTLFKDVEYVNSIIVSDEETEDTILRSNIFSNKDLKSGHRLILTPINYFSEYILQQINSTEGSQNYNPKLPLLNKNKAVLSDLLCIEREIKHTLKHFDLKLNKRFLEYLPLFINRKGPKKFEIKDGKYLLHEFNLKSIEIWKDESVPKNFLDVITFGRLERFVSQFKSTFYIGNQIILKKNAEDFINELNIDEDELYSVSRDLNELVINKDSNISIYNFINNGVSIIRVFNSDLSITNFLISQKLSDNIIEYSPKYFFETPEIFRIYSTIGLFQNMSKFSNILLKLIEYRNATAHMKELSDTAYKEFFNLKREYYKQVALRIPLNNIS